MKKYIDQETIKHQLLTLFAHNKELIDEWLVYCVDDLIDDIPAADVVEVQHGEWVEFHCSVCGKIGWDNEDNYCPNCGAKMDGGAEYAAD